jgi:hypothetical protein
MILMPSVNMIRDKINFQIHIIMPLGSERGPFVLQQGCLQRFETITAVISWAIRWRIWLSHCATSWKIAGSIPGGISGIYH